MRSVSGISLPLLLSLLFCSVSACSRLDQDLTLEVGSWSFKFPTRSQANPEPVLAVPTFPKRVNAAIPPAKAAVDPERGWGNCDSAANHEPIGSATAELVGVRLVSVSSGRVESLPVRPSPFDLLRFSSELSELLSEHALPSGEYSEIRVLLRNAFLVDKKGHRTALAIPKGDTEGIAVRLNRALSIEAGAPKVKVTLTFCTGNNFLVEQTQDHGVRNAFHPVIDRVINLSI